MSRPDLLKGEDLLPEPSQGRSREKRKRIKEAGLALFGEKGYDAASIDELAETAGLAVGGFYQHFRSKRQLLLVLMDELLERMNDLDLRPKGGGNVRNGLRAFLTTAFSTERRFLGAYRAWREAAITDRDLAEKDRAIRTWSGKRILMAFTLLQQLPGARAGIDVKVLAEMMDGCLWDLVGHSIDYSGKQLSLRVDAATHLIFHALFVDS